MDHDPRDPGILHWNIHIDGFFRADHDRRLHGLRCCAHGKHRGTDNGE